jgi:hypothetical protein
MKLNKTTINTAMVTALGMAMFIFIVNTAKQYEATKNIANKFSL